MLNINEPNKCCGCTACYNVCPVNAIKMMPDKEGFLYPSVDVGKCINCGKCEKVCLEISGFTSLPILSAYTVRSVDSQILKTSTSGGAFSPMARLIIANQGVVYGVGYDEDWSIMHMRVDQDAVKLTSFRGSKYVQSKLGNTFILVKHDLEEGKKVLFSGTPCQVAGLNNFLAKRYDNLYTVEVICHGTPSPYLWETYLKYQKCKYHSEPSRIVFRNKTYGYHSGTMEIVFQNGKTYHGSARTDMMLKSFFQEIASRPSCYTCPCKGMKRPADVSIFDAWHADKLVNGLKDDDKGYTNVFVNSENGKWLLMASQNQRFSVDVSQAVSLDGIMVCNQPHMHPKRSEFYQILADKGIEEAVQSTIPIRVKDHLIEKSKSIFYKVGVFTWVKRTFKRKK